MCVGVGVGTIRCINIMMISKIAENMFCFFLNAPHTVSCNSTVIKTKIIALLPVAATCTAGSISKVGKSVASRVPVDGLGNFVLLRKIRAGL